jgi:Divergent InlB B-repeat domain
VKTNLISSGKGGAGSSLGRGSMRAALGAKLAMLVVASALFVLAGASSLSASAASLRASDARALLCDALNCLGPFEATGPGGAAVLYPPTLYASTCDPAPGSMFPIGTTAVMCASLASSLLGNPQYKLYLTVLVVDSTPPTISVTGNPSNVAAGASVTFQASATDIVDGTDPVICNPASGFTASTTTTVTCNSSDKAGNAASSVQFTVAVKTPQGPPVPVPVPVPTPASPADGSSSSPETSGSTVSSPSNAAQQVAIAPQSPQAPYVPPVLEKLSVGVAGAGTVTSSGISCGGSLSRCVGTFKPGMNVRLKARPKPGFRFTVWSGACSGRSTICGISLEGDVGVKASFAAVHPASTVPFALDQAAFLVRWDESVGSGKLALGGTIGKPASVSVVLHRPGSSKPLLTEQISLPKGRFSLSLRLAPGTQGDGEPLLPGAFVVSIGGHSGSLVVPTEVRTVTLPAPPHGVALTAFASSTAHGSPAPTIPAAAGRVFVHFVFGSQPDPDVPVSVAWYSPDGKLLGVAPKTNRRDVDSSITSGGQLPKGTWRADLRAGGAVVDTVTVQVV